MRWSVLLPTHDRADTLTLSMRSVLAQIDGDLELLVVGDGCDDATRAAVAAFGDPRVRFFDLPKTAGFGYPNRAIALRDAAGDRVAFAADDDLWAPGHLEALGAVIDDGNDLAYSLPLWVAPTGEIVPTTIDLNLPIERAAFAEDNYLPATCVVVTRAALEREGGWPTDVEQTADWTLWRRILAEPDSRVGVLPFGTALHFRASWRTWDHPAVDGILGRSREDGWWPAGARIPVGPGSQQEAAASIAADADWWRALADATASIERHLVFDWRSTRRELARMHEQFDQERRSRDDVERGYRSSTSWRVTAPLRQLAVWFAKRG